ncbi:MAG: hypothetical protein K2K13_05185 [Clostridiales bacterium]|nr:hypothetical protein [Clostridiales bacterium]
MKFLLRCLCAFIDCFSPPTIYSWWEALIGFLEVASVIVGFIVSAKFLTWYYAIAITIGYIAVVIGIAAIIEKIYNSKKQ